MAGPGMRQNTKILRCLIEGHVIIGSTSSYLNFAVNLIIKCLQPSQFGVCAGVRIYSDAANFHPLFEILISVSRGYTDLLLVSYCHVHVQ